MTDDEISELARLMVWGLDVADEIDGETVAADFPLSVKQAARWLGLRVKRARVHLSDPRFRKLYATECEALRSGERARNLKTAIAIRDDGGDGSAAFATARLKAIATIEGRDGGAGVTVNVNQTNQTLNVTPGYVIKLRPSEAPAHDATPRLAASAHADVIDVTAEPVAEEVGE